MIRAEMVGGAADGVSFKLGNGIFAELIFKPLGMSPLVYQFDEIRDDGSVRYIPKEAAR